MSLSSSKFDVQGPKGRGSPSAAAVIPLSEPPGMLTLRWWRRSLRLLWLFMHRQVLGVVSWRGFMLTLAIQQTVTPLLGLAVWSDVLPGQRAVTAYFITLMAVQMATVCYEADTYLHGITSPRKITPPALPAGRRPPPGGP